MRAVDARRRVLVTDGELRSVLAACRGLAQAGYRVSVVADGPLAETKWSRSCSVRFRAPHPLSDPEAFATELARILRREPHAVLLPGSEASLLAISDRRQLLEPLASLGLPSHETVERCLDKCELMRAAAGVEMDSPAAEVCDAGDVLRAARELGFPVVLKPIRTLRRDGFGGLHGEAVVPAPDEATLRRVQPSLRGRYLVQRFLPAARRFSAAGVMTEDGLRALVLARFRRTWPPEAGAVAFGETVAPPAGLGVRVSALLRRIGWRGIFELEYLETGAGHLAAIDLNPRPFGWMTLAVAAGANLPAIWCDELTAGTSIAATGRPGVRYRWEEADLAHFAWQVRRGRLRQAAAVLRPHRDVVHAHFSRADPAPLAARAASLGWATARRVAARVAGEARRHSNADAPARPASR